MASDSLKIELDVETRQAVQGLAAVARGLKSAEDGAGEAGSAFGRFTAGLRAGSDTAERWGANISRSASTLAGLTRSVIEGTAAHERNERALRTLGGAYDAVSRQTQGAFSAAEALRAQQGLVQSGLQLSSAELGSVTRAAREYALATGTEATAALEQLTDALRGGEAEGLRRFGVTLEANTTRSQSFRSALTQLESQQRGMAPSAQTMAEANAELGRTWDQLTGQLASNIAQWTNLRETMSGALAIMREVSESGLGTFTGDTVSARDNRASSNDLEARLGRRNAYQNAMVRARGRIGGTEGIEFGRADMNMSAAQQVAFTRRLESATTVEEIRRIADESRGVTAGNAAVRAQDAAAATARAAAEPAARDAANARSDARTASAGPRTREPSKADLEAAFALQLMIAADEAQEAKAAAMAAFVRQQTIENDNALVARETFAANAVKTEAETMRESERAKAREQDVQNGNATARARRENPAVTFREAFLPAAMETQTAAERMAEGVSGAFQTMTGALRSHIGAVIEGRETIGEALRAIAHETLLSLAQEAAAKSLMSLAGGIAASVTPGGQGTAAGLFAASAIYAGVAGLAGLGAMATAAPAAAPSAASAGARGGIPSAASAGGSGRSGGEGTAITINVNGTVMDREGTADSIRELLNDSLSRGGTLRAA